MSRWNRYDVFELIVFCILPYINFFHGTLFFFSIFQLLFFLQYTVKFFDPRCGRSGGSGGSGGSGSGGSVQTYTAHASSVTAISCEPMGWTYATGCSDGDVRLWDLRTVSL